MNTTSQDLAILRAALAADEALFTHHAECQACNSSTRCPQSQRLYEQAAKLRGVALGSDAGLAELDTIMSTAEAIVRDIVQVVRAGRLDHDAQSAFQNWIVEALLAQPTMYQIDQLCRAAGFAGPVDVTTLKSRMDELHATIGGLMRELSECATQRAALYTAGQIIVDHWVQGDLAQAVRTLAALLPSREVVQHEAAANQ
jgi:hypothetical protein